MHELGLLKAISLGVLQGLTEFLPVSSSGHLVVAQQLLGITLDAQALAALDVALHAGTLVAVLVFYRRDLMAMLSGNNWSMVWLLILGTLPAAVIGIACKSHIESLFTSITVVGVAWLVTGVFLWATHYIPERDTANLTWGKSLMIGLTQAVAMIPGVSRSGSTIAIGMFLRLKPADAARYSFLLAIPAIGGSLLLEAKHLAEIGSDIILPIVAGVISAGVVGYLAIRWLLAIIARGQLRWFGCYCFVIGLLALVMPLVRA